MPCPACPAPEQPIHDRGERRWQHLHFFQFRVSSMPTAVGGVHAVNFSAARRPCVDETHARRGQRST
ncbi:TPA: transposase family protein [Pseudomonas aeruginosa]